MGSVGVIGGGGAGMCAARHLLAAGLRPQVWEAAAGLGGTWRYSPRTGSDQHGLPIYSSMYNSLRTNLPKEVMAFPDFPFSTGDASFVHHTDVAKYLNLYACHYNLEPHIKTEHHVERVLPLARTLGPPRWAITVRDLKNQATTTTVYDSVIVCNGHYSIPNVPRLPGLEQYRGRQMHSHDYRKPQPFTGASILVLGAGASGIDIAIELTSVAKQVYLSHNMENIKSDLPKNMQQVKGATQATNDGFLLADGTHVEADVIVYCTGYKYSFPFLTKACGLSVTRGQVTPLYRHIFNSYFPSMAFIGIPLQICPFPMFDVQVRYVTKVLMGGVCLPSPEDMVAITQEEVWQHLKQGHIPEDFHLMALDQWKYMEELEGLTGESAVLPAVEKLFTAVRSHRNENLLTYKQTNYKFTGPESYTVV